MKLDLNEVQCFCGEKIPLSPETLTPEIICPHCGKVPMTVHQNTINALQRLNKLFKTHQPKEIISIRYNAGNDQYEVTKDEKT